MTLGGGLNKETNNNKSIKTSGKLNIFQGNIA